MRSFTTEEKYQLLRKYAHRLKLQLKEHSGESFVKGSPLDNKLHTYKKLKKLIQYYSQSQINKKDDKVIRQIDSYYDVFKHKFAKESAKNSLHEKARSFKPEILVHKAKAPVETDEDSGDDEITEVGPTPQLNGRVLTIFDIQTSPEKLDVSPLKGKQTHALEFNVSLVNKTSDDNEVFKTPSKPASKNQKDISGLSGLSGASKRLTFTENQIDHEAITPKKKIAASSNLIKTPQYIKNNTIKLSSIDNIILEDEWSDDDSDLDEANNFRIEDDNDDVTTAELNELEKLPDLDEEMNAKAEPSPLIKRTGRSLFQIHSDARGLKRNLSTLQSLLDGEENIGSDISELESINPPEGSETDNVPAANDENQRDDVLYDEYDPHARLRIKMKTIKRSTRRAKLKTERVDLKDDMENFNIHALARGELDNAKVEEEHMPTETDTPLSMQITTTSKFDLEDQDSDDDTYVRKGIEQLQNELGTAKGKGKHPLSNNFVRLKINRGNRGGRFKRRR